MGLTISKAQREQGNYFDGGYWNLWGIKFTNALIVIMSAGLLAPLAMNRIYKYEVEHTVLSGQRLKFTGTLGSAFMGYIKLWVLCWITGGIYAFKMPQYWMNYKVAHTELPMAAHIVEG